MALQFQPPTGVKTKEEKNQELFSQIANQAATIPSLWLQYKNQRMQHQLAGQELELKKRQIESQYGTGKAKPVSAPLPLAGTGEQPFGPELPAETPEDEIRRLGTEAYKQLHQPSYVALGANGEQVSLGAGVKPFSLPQPKAPAPAKGQLRVTDQNVPLIFNPSDNSLTVQGTGEPYNAATHGNLIVPGAQPMLPAAQGAEISDVNAARKQLRDLVQGAATYGFGEGNPYLEKARASRLNPFQLMDPKAQKFKQLTAATKQIIGKGLEGGVLRKEDEYKYEAIIPKAGDTADVLKTKAQQLDDLLNQRQTERIKGFSSYRGVPQSENLQPILPPENGQSGGLPPVGTMFQGGKVLKVRRIE